MPGAALKPRLAQLHIAHQLLLALIMIPIAVIGLGWVFVPVPPYTMSICSRIVALRAAGEAIPVAASERLDQKNLNRLRLPMLRCLLIRELLARA